MGCSNGTPVHEDKFDKKSVKPAKRQNTKTDKLGNKFEDLLMESLSSDGSSRHDSEEAIATEEPENEPAPTFCKVNSDQQFADPDQTVIIFDWDDTLCPSAWLRKMEKSGKQDLRELRRENEEQLRNLAFRVIELLGKAKQLGKVVLVTNAAHPWVEVSCSELLPEAKEVLAGLPVIYAQELITAEEKKLMPRGIKLTEAKARAMRAAVADFYSRYEGQSWKNVISIGDGHYEHDAIRQVTHSRPHSMVAGKNCRTKTVKMLNNPSTVNLGLELSIISKWLPKIIYADCDIHTDFGCALELSIPKNENDKGIN